MSEQQLLPEPRTVSSENSRIDFRRIIYKTIRYWYWVVISLGIAFVVAMFINRYSQRIYPASASIMIHEAEEGSTGDILYKNEIAKPYRNYLNEIYFLKSYPLIELVIKDLHFDVVFYREGNVVTSEIYDIPVEVNVLNEEIGSFSSLFAVVNQHEFRLKPKGGADGWQTFRFRDTIAYRGLRVIFKPAPHADLKGSGELVFTYTSPKSLAGAYAGRISASWAEKGAGVINLYTSGTNPKKSLDFLSGLITRYQMYDLDKKNQKAANTVRFITDQLKEISDSLKLIENKLELFKSVHLITNYDLETERLYAKVKDIEVQKTELSFRENYYKYLTDYLNRGADMEQVILPSSVGLSDLILTQLLTNIISLQADLRRGTIRETNKMNPLVQDKLRRLQETKDGIVESIRNQLNTDQIRKAFIDKQIRDWENQMGVLPAAEREYVSIKRSYSLLENLYIFLLQKRAEAAISKASATTDIEVINDPAAGGPISPKPSQNYFLAFFIGLAVPLGIFSLMEYFNTRVQSKEDIEKITSIPFLGGLGHKEGKDNLVVMSLPKSAMAEYFRSLRSNLSYFLKDKQNVVILVTSSISGEGKTFTSINLASIIAFTGKKTLIVGADMRRPKMVDDFKLNNDKGLSSYLVEISTFEEVIQKTELENLDLVSGGPVPPNPAELLLRPRMEQFFAEARSKYDYIIVDSPPMAIVSDANNMTRFCDHQLFIVRQNYTQKDFLRSMQDFYLSGRIKNISIVLNDIFKSGPGYGFGKGSGYGYGYGSRFANKKKKNGYGYYTES